MNAPLHQADPGRPRAPEPVDEDTTQDVEDFDAWRAARKAARGGGKRTRVFGRLVTLPTSLPLGLITELEEASGSSSMDDVKTIVGRLYGEDALEYWSSTDADLEDFQILLGYGMSVAQGQNRTFDEIAATVEQALTEHEKKAEEKAKKARKRSGNPSKRAGR